MSKQGGHILVIGAATIDVKGRASKGLQLGTSVPGTIKVSFGGVARNVADNLARLGQSVVLISAVGKDGLGKQILERTAAAGVDDPDALGFQAGGQFADIPGVGGGQAVAETE